MFSRHHLCVSEKSAGDNYNTSVGYTERAQLFQSEESNRKIFSDFVSFSVKA